MSLLQDTIYPLDTLAGATQQPVELANEKISLIGLLFKAGWIMIPLLLLLFATLVVFIERYITIKRASKDDPRLMSHVNQSVPSGRFAAGVSVSPARHSGPGGTLGPRRPRTTRPMSEREGAIQNTGTPAATGGEKYPNRMTSTPGLARRSASVGPMCGVMSRFRD